MFLACDIRYRKEALNGINIDYFRPDFNRYPNPPFFKAGLTFGAILFIIIFEATKYLPTPGPGLHRGQGERDAFSAI
jgi:hypothetical protein